jgi:hypothetical protein
MTKGRKNMKPKTTKECEAKTVTRNTLRQACTDCYQKVLGQITTAKEMIFAESQQALTAPERLLRLALNEAEALAWQTTYPHLIFPTLATEKIQAVAVWNANQQSVRRNSPVFAWAA